MTLDGLEPLQYADKANRGELKDRALRSLLKALASFGNGLCIVTTRLAVHELSDRAHVLSHNLNNLALADGVQLLDSLGVKGHQSELEAAVEDYDCHALALSLLGNLLRIRYQGDVRKRGNLDNLVSATGARENVHAFKVMQAYAEWFAGKPELALLSLLGLFDQPIDIEVLRVLWAAQIPDLTEGIDEDDWWEAIYAFQQDYQLLAQRGQDEELDCHPLIREYFGKILQEQQPTVWQQAHTKLYDYYKALPEKEFPDTLEEMQPLFHAVEHGCKAGLYQKAYSEVYWPRITARNSHIWYDLGAYSDDLSVLANFFDVLWMSPNDSLDDYSKTTIANRASYCLGALGREEAELLMKLTIDGYMKAEDAQGVITSLSNLVHFYLDLGRVMDANKLLESYFDYCENSNDYIAYLTYYFTLANVMHQLGSLDLAKILFDKVEKTQKEHKGFPYLYAAQGYLYLDLLIDLASGKKTDNLFNRAFYGLKLSATELGSFSESLYLLSLGRLYRKNKKFPKSLHYLNQGIDHIEQANHKQYIARFHLEIAKTYAQVKDIVKAHIHMEAAYEIAKNYGLRLIQTDYHLEMSRLLIAEGKSKSEIFLHVEKANDFIQATSYHRRDNELAELRKQLEAIST